MTSNNLLDIAREQKFDCSYLFKKHAKILTVVLGRLGFFDPSSGILVDDANVFLQKVFFELRKYGDDVALEAIKELQIYVFYLKNEDISSFELKKVPVFLGPEKSYLRDNFDQPFCLYTILIDGSRRISELSDVQKIGLVYLSMTLESAIYPCKKNSVYFKKLYEEMWRLESFYIVQNSFKNESAINLLRFIVDPLTIALSIQTKSLYGKYSTSSCDDLYYLLRASLVDLVSFFGFTADKNLVTRSMIQLLKLKLPGFLLDRSSHKFSNTDVSFDDAFDLYHKRIGFSKCELSHAYLESKEDDSHLARVKAKYVSTSDFESFINFIDTNAHMSDERRLFITLICSLCFYCGLRRQEAYHIRCCDIKPASVRSVIRIREYDGHTLKSKNAIRNAFLDFMPDRLQALILKIVLSNPESDYSIFYYLAPNHTDIMMESVCNDYLGHYFNHSNVSLHSLRHSFATRTLFCLVAQSYSLGTQFVPPRLLEDILYKRDIIINVLMLQDGPCHNYLFNLVELLGHNDSRITIHSYLHHLDFMTLFALNNFRPHGYDSAVSSLMCSSSTGLKNTSENFDIISELTYSNDGKKNFYPYKFFKAFFADFGVPIKMFFVGSPFCESDWYDYSSLLQLGKFFSLHEEINFEHEFSVPIDKSSTEMLRFYDAYKCLKSSGLGCPELSCLLKGFHPKGFFSIESGGYPGLLLRRIKSLGFFKCEFKALHHGVSSAFFQEYAPDKCRFRNDKAYNVRFKHESLKHRHIAVALYAIYCDAYLRSQVNYHGLIERLI